jgi:hypothetical protein
MTSPTSLSTTMCHASHHRTGVALAGKGNRRHSHACSSRLISERVTHLENSSPLEALSGPFQRPLSGLSWLWVMLAGWGLAEKMYFLTGRRSAGQRPLQCAVVGSEFPGSRSMWAQGISQALGLERWPRNALQIG